ncbi:hypothetical protein AUR61_011225 [Stutzerimonas balearica]|nr:hypothetical protein AUR61_011225 [Stutzerimonas balearica]
MLRSVYVVGEDIACCSLAKAILEQLKLGVASYEQNTHGFGELVKIIDKMNGVAANAMPVLMIADGDQSECVVEQINSWMPAHPADKFVLRLAVREAESWVLADREGLSEFAQVDVSVVPREPDDIRDPKQSLLSIIRKSKRRDLKEEMLPGKKSKAPVGLGYNLHLSTFIRENWSLARASNNSPSLARAIPRLAERLGR